jgi:hypothetical protein
MLIREIVSEDATPPARRLPGQLTVNDVQSIRDPGLISAMATVAADPNSREDAETLSQQLASKEAETDRRAADAQPYANLLQSAGQDPKFSRRLNDVISQAAQASQRQQQVQQQQQQAPAGAPRPPVYGQGSASANKPVPPTPVGK